MSPFLGIYWFGKDLTSNLTQKYSWVINVTNPFLIMALLMGGQLAFGIFLSASFSVALLFSAIFAVTFSGVIHANLYPLLKYEYNPQDSKLLSFVWTALFMGMFPNLWTMTPWFWYLAPLHLITLLSLPEQNPLKGSPHPLRNSQVSGLLFFVYPTISALARLMHPFLYSAFFITLTISTFYTAATCYHYLKRKDLSNSRMKTLFVQALYLVPGMIFLAFDFRVFYNSTTTLLSNTPWLAPFLIAGITWGFYELTQHVNNLFHNSEKHPGSTSSVVRMRNLSNQSSPSVSPRDSDIPGLDQNQGSGEDSDDENGYGGNGSAGQESDYETQHALNSSSGFPDPLTGSAVATQPQINPLNFTAPLNLTAFDSTSPTRPREKAKDHANQDSDDEQNSSSARAGVTRTSDSTGFVPDSVIPHSYSPLLSFTTHATVTSDTPFHLVTRSRDTPYSFPTHPVLPDSHPDSFSVVSVTAPNSSSYTLASGLVVTRVEPPSTQPEMADRQKATAFKPVPLRY